MTLEQAHNAIRGRFHTQVANALPILTQYDNQDFVKPTNTKWARLTILMGEGRQVSVGTGLDRVRFSGVAMVQVFGPLNVGDKDLITVVDTVRSKFLNVTDSGVVFMVPSMRRLGRSENEYQINVECPFYFDTLE